MCCRADGEYLDAGRRFREDGREVEAATSKSGRAHAKRGKLQRGALTPELIVEESLALLDTAGVAGFSLPKLGAVLGADPTAVYRHFQSKDDLVLAIADCLIE